MFQNGIDKRINYPTLFLVINPAQFIGFNFVINFGQVLHKLVVLNKFHSSLLLYQQLIHQLQLLLPLSFHQPL
jgi:hypothetical protein